MGALIAPQGVTMSELLRSKTWQALDEHHRQMMGVHMRDLFAEDADRFERYSRKFNDILVDFSKNIINNETLSLLMELARERDVPDWTRRMFAGEKINSTEHRAVLHIEKTCCHLIGDECFFDMLDESRGCAMCVRTLAGSRSHAMTPREVAVCGDVQIAQLMKS